MVDSVNITLNAYNIVIGIILFIYISLRYHLNDKVQGWFKVMVSNNALMSAANILTIVFQGSVHPLNNVILPVAMFVFYAISFAMIITTGIEIMFFFENARYKQILYYSMAGASIIYLVFLVFTPSTGFLYEFDRNNVYFRGRLFIVPALLQIALLIALLVFLLLNRKTVDKKQIITIVLFLFFPVTAQIFQIKFVGLSLVSTGYSITFLVMFVLANRALEASLDNREVELDEKESELHQKISEVERSKLEVIKMQNHTIESLSNLVENRDEDTGEHVRRTRAYVELLALQLMKNGHYPETINSHFIRLLKHAAPMHDIGKIVVPDSILKKPARLTPEEFELMKRHASEGGRIVHEILDGFEDPEYIKITADIATHHHEKWDGSGYPNGLKGEEIPLCARIMALADVFDALVSPRIYKSPMSYEEAFKIIEEGRGTHFDPVMVDEFLNIKEKNAAINESFKNY